METAVYVMNVFVLSLTLTQLFFIKLTKNKNVDDEGLVVMTMMACLAMIGMNLAIMIDCYRKL